MATSDSVVISGRLRNEITLDANGNIFIEGDQSSIELKENVLVLGDDIILSSHFSDENDDYAVVYGEKLVEILKFLLKTLKSHKHPPNASPIPDFYPEADRIIDNIENILNHHVRTR